MPDHSLNARLLIFEGSRRSQLALRCLSEPPREAQLSEEKNALSQLEVTVTASKRHDLSQKGCVADTRFTAWFTLTGHPKAALWLKGPVTDLTCQP
jgi:hypothetical protein